MSVVSKAWMSNRRVFMIQAVSATGVALLASEATAQAMVAETDPQAVSLGYKADASKVDKAKFPKFAASQNCGNCALYQGKAGSAAGACGIFPGKQVAAKGWCSAWAKKA
ncbi:MAG: high-potential iron-sulfur protein [Curvibacter sp.]